MAVIAFVCNNGLPASSDTSLANTRAARNALYENRIEDKLGFGNDCM